MGFFTVVLSLAYVYSRASARILFLLIFGWMDARNEKDCFSSTRRLQVRRQSKSNKATGLFCCHRRALRKETFFVNHPLESHSSFFLPFPATADGSTEDLLRVSFVHFQVGFAFTTGAHPWMAVRRCKVGKRDRLLHAVSIVSII